MVMIPNGQVPNIVLALQELVQMRVNVRTGMKIRKLARLVEQQVADVEAERLRLIELYALRDDEGSKIVKEDKTFDVEEEFFTKLDELLGLTFTAEPLTVAEMEAVGEITPATLIGLGDLLVE